MLAGVRGKQRANQQAVIEQMRLALDGICEVLDSEQAAKQTFLELAGWEAESDLLGLRTSSKVVALIDEASQQAKALEIRAKGALPAAERAELGLYRAAVAVVEGRFGDALALLAEVDQPGLSDGDALSSAGRPIRILRLQADAFYGLQRWREALLNYRRLRNLFPSRELASVRIADCLWALDLKDEASNMYREVAKRRGEESIGQMRSGQLERVAKQTSRAIQIQVRLLAISEVPELRAELATSYSVRGNAEWVNGKLSESIADYDEAIRLQTDGTVHERSAEAIRQLALSYNDRGNALLAAGRSKAASTDYEKAIELQTSLSSQNRSNEFGYELAVGQKNLANALLAQQHLVEAVARYDKAIGDLTALLARERQRDWMEELAVCCNNRGALVRTLGKPRLAAVDFDRAIGVLEPLARPAEEEPLAPVLGRSQRFSPARATLDVLVGCTDNGLEVISRARVFMQREKREPTVALAVSLRNRGYTQLSESQLERAITDFEKAASIFAQLVDDRGLTDFGVQYAKSLNPLAWIYATNPEGRVRDGRKAEQYARRACDLTEWKSSVPLECLAAASAELGQFAEALKWQERALSIVSPPGKRAAQSRLELYRVLKPYRNAGL